MEDNKNLEQSFKAPLKKQGHFEKRVFNYTVERHHGIYQKQLILLVWKDLHFIEN